MEFNDVIKLFKKASIKNVWGSDTHLYLFNDGSGEILSGDNDYKNDIILEFSSLDELIQKLEKSLK